MMSDLFRNLYKFWCSLIVLLLLPGCQTTPARLQSIPQHNAPVALCGTGEMMMQTTLWLSAVPEQEWQLFLRDELMPRFGDTLTSYDAAGKGEARRVVVLLYPPDVDFSAVIERARDRYRARFNARTTTRIDTLVCAAVR